MRCLLLLLLAACVSMSQAREERLNQLCSNPQSAYEDGYNSGLQRQPMNTASVDRYCAPQTRDQQRDAYLSGYNAGIEHAVVVRSGWFGGYATPAAAPAPVSATPATQQ